MNRAVAEMPEVADRVVAQYDPRGADARVYKFGDSRGPREGRLHERAEKLSPDGVFKLFENAQATDAHKGVAAVFVMPTLENKIHELRRDLQRGSLPTGAVKPLILRLAFGAKPPRKRRIGAALLDLLRQKGISPTVQKASVDQISLWIKSNWHQLPDMIEFLKEELLAKSLPVDIAIPLVDELGLKAKPPTRRQIESSFAFLLSNPQPLSAAQQKTVPRISGWTKRNWKEARNISSLVNGLEAEFLRRSLPAYVAQPLVMELVLRKSPPQEDNVKMALLDLLGGKAALCVDQTDRAEEIVVWIQSQWKGDLPHDVATNNDVARVANHLAKSACYLRANLGDFSSQLMLRTFVKEQVQNLPTSDRFLVVLSGHGSGAVGDFLTDSSPFSSLSIPQLATILREALSEYRQQKAGGSVDLSGKKIDIPGMDSCLMSMVEVCSEVQDCVEYLVGAEGYSRNAGWPYFRVLEAVDQNTKTSGTVEGLARHYCRRLHPVLQGLRRCSSRSRYGGHPALL